MESLFMDHVYCYRWATSTLRTELDNTNTDVRHGHNWNMVSPLHRSYARRDVILRVRIHPRYSASRRALAQAIDWWLETICSHVTCAVIDYHAWGFLYGTRYISAKSSLRE